MSNLINVAIFYLAWFGIVLNAPAGGIFLPLALAALAMLHFLIASRDRQADIIFVCVCSLTGVAFDSLVVWFGAFSFITPLQPNLPPYPIWMVCLWIVFATTLQRSLYRVVRNPYLSGLFGLLGGPLSYLAAEALHVLIISAPRFRSLIMIGFEWLTLMVIFYLMVRRKYEPASARI